MSDKASSPGVAPEIADAPEWRIDGSETYLSQGGNGLDDTVVRLPPIPGPGAAVTLPPPPAQPSPTSPPAWGHVDPGATQPPAKPANAKAGNNSAVTATAVHGTEFALPTLPAFAPPAPAPAAEPEARTASAPVSPSVAAAPHPPTGTPTAKPAGAPRPSGGRRTRKARLRVSRIDPWSVMKTSFLFSIAFGIMFWVAIYVVWSVIGASGLFEAINSVIVDLLSSPNDTTPWRIEDYVNTNKVLGISALIAVINVVLMTALGTLTAFLYNLSANILGGLELTLAED